MLVRRLGASFSDFKAVRTLLQTMQNWPETGLRDCHFKATRATPGTLQKVSFHAFFPGRKGLDITDQGGCWQRVVVI